MITTKREVEIENNQRERVSVAPERIMADEHIVTLNPQIEVRPFDTYPAPGRVEQREPIARITPNEIKSEDLMPTIHRMEEYEDMETKPEVRKLSSKAKAMVFVYMAATLILALIVLATGIAITQATKDVTALEGEVNAKSAVLSETTNTLIHYSDDQTITGIATELGMVKNSSTRAIDLIELNEIETYPPRTNMFDRLCDFVSKVIGNN